MNFLAHCALADLAGQSADADAWIAGGVLADFIRGPVPTDWPVELQHGVRLHRRIDAASNRHPAIQESCARFPAQLRRFAPIFVDVFADRVLSNQWPSYHDDDIARFATRCYAAIDASDPAAKGLHQDAMRFIRYMKEENLLASYGEWQHVSRGVSSVCRRLRRPQLAEPAEAALRALETPLADDFSRYFPDLIVEAQRFTAER